MTIETATHVSDLNTSYPAAGDPKSEGDDHIRLIKTVIKTDVSTISASLSTVTAGNANVSTSLGNVSTSLGNVSTSLTAVSSATNVASSAASTAQSGVTSVATSLSTTTSTVSAVSSTVAGLGGGALTFVSAQTASNSASITFSGLTSGYDYLVIADNIQGASSAQIYARVQYAGPADITTGYYYSGYEQTLGTSTVTNVAGNNAAYFVFDANAIDTSTRNVGELYLRITNPSATAYHHVEWSAVVAGASSYYAGRYHGVSTDINPVVGIKFYMSTGNISIGNFRLYKIARS